MSGAGRNRHNGTGRNGAGRSEAGRNGAGRNGAGRSEAGRNGAGRSEAGRNGAGRSEAGRSEAGRNGKSDRDRRRPDQIGRKEHPAKRTDQRPPAVARPARQVAQHSILKMGRIKGEWMEIRLPDQLVGAPLSRITPFLPLAPKLVSKLLQSRGILVQGPNLRVHLFPREDRDYPSDWMELNILYEDEFTLVVYKPAGIEVHPSEKGQRRTLAHAVAAYYEMSGQDVRIRHIHRIDKDTTGPVLYAKNEFAHYQYDKAMREKNIERVYLALAEGQIEGERGTINRPIGQDRHHSTRRRVSETGDPAITHFEVVERLRDHTLVRLRLETGRTHQIRVHLSSLNHPLAGDGMYGGKRGFISRQALHGERLIWNHPWTGEKQNVKATLPEDFNDAINRLREE
ncbi:MAG: RluA family pseudouridine synthase [Candidatus Cohnella colombiensis]|uniref:Pseudouridine synthase n=1 Tax=Candidatus Cohnella colombiensis TaxID=3121368 RepID=A0AA95EU35_9BACL|nr:MAG: RluA family pseudouridine synthase [Cohnella sp.]